MAQPAISYIALEALTVIQRMSSYISKLIKFVKISRNQGLQNATGRTLNTLGILDKMIYNLKPATFRGHYPGEINTMDKDWDNLILLDALRYDIFKNHSKFKETPIPVVSKGNDSWSFMKENFINKTYHDTVYVTANPYAEQIGNNVFHAIESVLDKWSSEFHTVLPEDVTSTAVEASNKYPNKRIIVHYMQPHVPHLGDIAESIDVDVTGGNWMHHEKQRGDEITIWSAYINGIINKDQLHKSYIQNLNIVGNSVRNLVDELTGKIVISSDHGENLGEKYFGFEVFGHGQDTKECRIVPWLQLSCDERKQIVSEKPIGNELTEENNIDERLHDLGYL